MTESVATQFPHPELTQLLSHEETPNHASLLLLHKELNANAMSVPSIRGSGQHGHLILTINAATYLALGAIAFDIPQHPGAAPVHPAQSTATAITERNRQHLADLKEFQTYSSVEASLKKLLIAAVPDTYIDALSDDQFGYATTTTFGLLQHLDTTYGTITTDDLDRNLEELNREWGTDQPIEDLWKQIRKCRVFASNNDPISEATAVRASIQNLERTGVFSDAIKDWRKRPDADRTLPNLQSAFNLANKERLRTLTIRDGGFAGNVSRRATDPNHPSEPSAPTTSTGHDFIHYCWSHGLGTNSGHTSATCRFKAEGHQDAAVVSNMLGGCNLIHRRRNERSIYRRPTSEATP